MPLGTPNTSTTEYFTPPVAATVTVLPPHVYEVSTDPSVYRMAFHQGIWVPNDDSGYYNIHITNDLNTNDAFVGGRAKIANMGMAQAHGFLNIPNGWRATNIFVDIHSNHADTLYEPLDGVGPRPGINYTIYEVKTWTTADPIVPATDGPNTIGGVVTTATTNTLYELDETMVGAIDNAMWILLATGATWHMVAGGYVVIEEV